MAFDRPIEADRIDDFNLFSAFVRAPLWILGGMLGSSANDDEEDNCARKGADANALSGRPAPGSANPPSARVVSSDDLHSTNLTGADKRGRVENLHRFGDCSVEWKSTADNPLGSKALVRSKNLSWSDESGGSLVECYDESALRHEPSPYRLTTSANGPKPKKSSLRRSRSIRSSVGDGKGMGPLTNEKTRYIPKMNQSEGGIVMPTRPYNPSAPGGVESPQWGWYINTTPPTPEMYHTHNGMASKSANRSGATSQTTQSQPLEGKACHNQVFQNLQNANRPMGWTSVPI